MWFTMADPSDEDASLVESASAGDQTALAELFRRHRDRLRQMVRLRMDQRLQGRVDASDVLQEAFLEASRRLEEYQRKDAMPFFLWLRLVVGQKLIDAHRHHLGAKMRDAGREISLFRGPMPEASSVELAARLLGQLTSPTRALERAEAKLRIEQALNNMDEIDREVLSLRHFEALSNGEAAQVLGISAAAASNRYVRALKRLKAAMEMTRGIGGGQQ